MKPVKVGLIGLGTVGTGTVKVLMRNADEISRRAGRQIIPTIAAVKDLSKKRDIGDAQITITDDPLEVANDPDVDVIVELMGGTQLALDVLMKAIENGKHVVSANKALIAIHGNEIFSAAHTNNVIVAFEAAVAGGIPVIKAIREGLAANRIEWLAGIINGTGNFILTSMESQQSDFADVLKEAQELGYAEADPTFDVEGIDAAHKLTILASIAFGVPLQFDEVYTEGITQVSYDDILNAKELGYRIKHLGLAKRTDKGIELRVHPTLIPEQRLIANVNGVMNAIMVHGDAVGSSMYYGPGAGAEPTASSVVADLVDVVRTLTTDSENRVPHLAFQPDRLSDTPILPISDINCAYYLNIKAANQPGVLADMTRILGDHSISIEAIEQKRAGADTELADVIVLTHQTDESSMQDALVQLNDLDSVVETIKRIRVEYFN